MSTGLSTNVRTGVRTSIPATVLPEPTLAELKAKKIESLEAKFLSRVQAQNPSLSSMEQVGWAKEQWLSIAPSARQATAKLQNAIDNYTAAKDALEAINGFTQEADVIAYNVTTGPAWPT